MRVSPLRTISGRILAGFFVLVLTLGGVSLWSVLQLRQVGRDLRLHRQAYLDISLNVTDFYSRQDSLIDTLDRESDRVVRGELIRARASIAKTRKLQRDLLDKNLVALSQTPRRGREIAKMESDLTAMLAELDANDRLAEGVLDVTLTPEQRKARFDEYIKKERQTETKSRSWLTRLRNVTKQSSANLEEAERRARTYAIVLGSLALLVALLTTAAAVLTLRPLARLRDGVRKVAAGDYGNRLRVAGSTEVDEVAREFNVMAAALAQREAELIRSERLAAVGKMAAVITHEVRNPLSSIGLNTELLEEEVRRLAGEGSEPVALCRAIEKEVDRLTAITEEYLRFARMPRPKLDKENVNTIVSGVVEFQREDLAMRGVRVDLRLAEDLPLVSADEAQLRQALLNLIKNAADAMVGSGTNRTGKLTIETRAVDGVVEIHVADDGPGIPADAQPRIFEPFFSTKEGGTGLGLALTQQIVLEHGGRIEVDSRPGAGTRFTVALPRA